MSPEEEKLLNNSENKSISNNMTITIGNAYLIGDLYGEIKIIHIHRKCNGMNITNS